MLFKENALDPYGIYIYKIFLNFLVLNPLPGIRFSNAK